MPKQCLCTNPWLTQTFILARTALAHWWLWNGQMPELEYILTKEGRHTSVYILATMLEITKTPCMSFHVMVYLGCICITTVTVISLYWISYFRYSDFHPWKFDLDTFYIFWCLYLTCSIFSLSSWTYSIYNNYLISLYANFICTFLLVLIF